MSSQSTGGITYSLVEGPWITWDKAKSAFITSSTHPATYVGHLRNDKLTIAYTPEGNTAAFDVSLNAAVKKAILGIGSTFYQFSNNFPSTSGPVPAATQAASVNPNVVISANVVPALYPSIQSIYQRACIPMIDMFAEAITKPAPKFQSVYSVDGTDMANEAIQAARQRHWSGSKIWVVSCGLSTVASAPGTIRDVVTTFDQKVAGALGVPAHQVAPLLECPNPPEGARTAMANWLTAHPQAKYIVGSTWEDEYGMGMLSALQASGYTGRALLVGRGAEVPALQLIAKSNPIYVATLNPGFLQWGPPIVALAEDVAAGDPVPSYIAPPSTMVDTSAEANSLLHP